MSIQIMSVDSANTETIHPRMKSNLEISGASLHQNYITGDIFEESTFGQVCKGYCSTSGESAKFQTLHPWMKSNHELSRASLHQKYLTGDIIGEGAFGQVRKAYCSTSGEERAIKTVYVHSIQEAQMLAKEVLISKAVSHPHLVQTYDVFESRGEQGVHIVMDYMSHGTLFDAVESGVSRGGQLSERECSRIMKEVLQAVLYLHNVGIVHRDIKPENVLLGGPDDAPTLKLADFGLSDNPGTRQNRKSGMTMSGMVGTSDYMAPEIARGHVYTEKVDIWSVGILAYFLVTGSTPFYAEMDDEEVTDILKNGFELEFHREDWKGYTTEAITFVKSLACNDPEERLTALECLNHPWISRYN